MYVALTGLNGYSMHVNPGRCPGLLHFAPSGLMNGATIKSHSSESGYSKRSNPEFLLFTSRYFLLLKRVVSHSGSLGSCFISIPFAKAQRCSHEIPFELCASKRV